MSGLSHLPIAGAFAALSLESAKGGQLPPSAVRSLCTGIMLVRGPVTKQAISGAVFTMLQTSLPLSPLSQGVAPLVLSAKAWAARAAANGQGLTPVVLFILARLAVEAAVGALPLLWALARLPAEATAHGPPPGSDPPPGSVAVLLVARGTALVRSCIAPARPTASSESHH